MPDREKVVKGLNCCCGPGMCFNGCPYHDASEKITECTSQLALEALALLKEQDDALEQMRLDNEDLRKCYAELLKEQDELLKHEYWRGYNNGRADEKGLQEGTIIQTFSPD